jgi:hypothetical protein
VCQKFGDFQLVPTVELHPIIKPWPFYGMGVEFYRRNSSFIMKRVSVRVSRHRLLYQLDRSRCFEEVIEFITEHIIQRFSIPRTLTIEQGTSFVSNEVREFVESYKIKLLNSSSYYA